MDTLCSRYQSLLVEICDCVQSGNPPWLNSVAKAGPPIFARTGAVLRGLPAVIAWHVSAKLEKPTLVWELIDTNDLKGSAQEALFMLPANGGESIYGAIPHYRPRQVLDTPPVIEGDITSKSLRAQLDKILSSLGEASPPLKRDASAIVSLALAFLRPLGRSDWPKGKRTFPDRWTPERLCRVAAWARLLADSLVFPLPIPLKRKLNPPGRWSSCKWNDTKIQRIRSFAASTWIQSCLPAELREPVKKNKRQIVPEQPIRLDVFNTKEYRRAPAIGALAKQFPEVLTLWSEIQVPFVLESAEWHPKAALGLALAEELGIEPLPNEPGMAWRCVGRALRERMQHGEAPPNGLKPLPDDPEKSGAIGLWWKMSRDHRLSSWMHPLQHLTVGELQAEKLWDGEILANLVREFKPKLSEEKRKKIPVAWLLAAKVAHARRPKRDKSSLEADVRFDISKALACDVSWDSIVDSSEKAQWMRYKKPKVNGGVRWFDIPSEKLMNAQRRVHELLIAISHKDGIATAFYPGSSPALHVKSHAGAKAAVRADIANYFGSVRPEHILRFLNGECSGENSLLDGWSSEGRDALMKLIFLRRRGCPPYLPQGAPCSPSAANLAGIWLDRCVIHRAEEKFGAGQFSYTRYADDLVISTKRRSLLSEFHDIALEILEEATEIQGWYLRKSKTKLWNASEGEAMHLCGLRVPKNSGGRITLNRGNWRRARSALHRLSHRLDYGIDAPGDPNKSHGLLSYAYSATGDLRWLAYTSSRLAYMARVLAGPLFCESFLAGWSDESPIASTLTKG